MATRQATAFAPATVANVAVGFDLLGFALDGVGDRVTVRRTDQPGSVVVESIEGLVTELPREADRNTASVALLELVRQVRPDFGFAVALHKGIPLGSGMGGSAASAVAAVVAGNALLDQPQDKPQLLRYALAGEAAASGAPHADNAAPCLFGGLTAQVEEEPPEVVGIPVPSGLVCVLVHPHIRIDTRDARGVLGDSVALKQHVKQTMHLAGFLVGCFRDDAAMVGRSMHDVIVEPQRSKLIPGFDEAKQVALAAGALGLSISGSGPSLFAWATSREQATAIQQAIQQVFNARGLDSDAWVSPVNLRGAELIEDGE